MPEMTAMPILPSAAPLPSSSSAPSGLVARPDKAANQTSAGNVPSSVAESGATAEQQSFASILQRQLAQAMPVMPAPLPAPLLEAALWVDATIKPLPEAALLADAATQPLPEAALWVDTTTQPMLEPALLAEAIDQPLPEAVQLILPGEISKDLSLLPEKSDDDASQQETADYAAAASSPYLFALANNPSVRITTDSPSVPVVEEEPSAKTKDVLPIAVSTLLQPQLRDSKDTALAKPAELPQATANKPAEFAANLAVSPDPAPTQAKPGESAGSEADFENLLAAAQASSQNRNQTVHSLSHGAPALPVKTPVGEQGWDGEVGNKLVWMIGRQEQRAELVLYPPQLGRVEVSLSINAGQTNALFVSTNPAVRDALEAALPRLREMLADAGVNLGQAQVGADSGNQQAANQSTNNRENWDNPRNVANRFDLANGMDMQRPVETTQWLRQSNSLVDVFA